MHKILTLLLTLVLIGTTTSCANRKKKKISVENTQATEQAKISQQDFIIEGHDELSIENNKDQITQVQDLDVEAPQEYQLAPQENVAEVDFGSAPAPAVIGSEYAEYEVVKGDTLMLIAFKLYGDYSMWREIQGQNNGLSSSELIPGKKIKYLSASSEFKWVPNGDPYLIMRGDTLSKISIDKYKTHRRWREIYENNRPLIKDPNLIFAGFTIYTVPDSTVAAQ